jgi:hypothetical protein
MEPTVHCDYFLDAKQHSNEEIGVKALIQKLQRRQKERLECPVERIIAILERFGQKLLNRENPIHQLHPRSGIPFIAAWCQRQNLEKLLDISFESRESLDRFVTSKANGKRAFRAFPKGIAVHWMAGNVPTLGFLSMIMGLLTKNANVIKLPKTANTLLASLIEQLALINDSGYNGETLVRHLAVVRYDHSRIDIAKALSSEADVRVIWGGDDAVESIKALPTKIESNDIIFPNRTSCIIIGSNVKTKDQLKKCARRAAMDISIFEQKACASPHTIFLITDERDRLVHFAELLHKSLQDTLQTFPKSPPSQKEVSALLNLRAQYDMYHDAWYSSGTEFTILSDDKLQLGPAVGNRTIYLRMTKDLEKLAGLITPNVQSIGIHAEASEFDHITNLLGSRGVQRFTSIGAMTHFESPWDGFHIPQHLVRWTSRQNE